MSNSITYSVKTELGSHPRCAGSDKPIRAVIVGAGHRSLGYAAYALSHPEDLQIVGVAEPNPARREQAIRMFGLAESQCFAGAAELARSTRCADAVINGTMDELHVETSLPLLAAGYDVLLEKPMATDSVNLQKLVDAACRHGRRVMVCHVLRYAPFYAAICKCVRDGAIGTVINIQTVEHVSYHHMAVGFVRGKWNRKDRCGSSMLLAKCCHDLDLIVWMKGGVLPKAVGSVGGLMHFRPDQAPLGAGTRCLVDCPIEAQCDYSARKHYIDISNPYRWSGYTWGGLEHFGVCLTEDEREMLKATHPEFRTEDHRHCPIPPLEVRLKYLKEESPYGRCVWRCDNNVVDHQSVMVQFADGATATHNMVGGTACPMRSIHLIGTRGEIQGVFEEGTFALRRPDPRRGHEYSTEVTDVVASQDVSGALGDHGGGDGQLVRDFVQYVRGEAPSVSCTRLEDSVWGHRLVFAADQAMAESRVIEMRSDT